MSISIYHGHRREHHGPMVAVIECPDVQLLKQGIRALDDFPCLSIPSNARDSQYQVNCYETAGPYQACLYVNIF